MNGALDIFRGRRPPRAPVELKRRIRAEISAAGSEKGESPLWSAARLAWAILVLLALAAHLALDLDSIARSPLEDLAPTSSVANGREAVRSSP